MAMTKQLRIIDSNQLPKLVELIHDRWLDAESIAFDAENSTLSIRYLKETGPRSSFLSRARFPALECFLRISKVESFSVHDPQKVRFYDMDTVAYDPQSMCVRLKTGVPIEIRAVVRDLDLTVEETDTVVQC
jgi:hypothetical protein